VTDTSATEAWPAAVAGPVGDDWPPVVADPGATRWEMFEPDPAPVEPWVTVISVDDHVIEPPSVFQSRVPERLAADAPRVVEKPDHSQVWLFEDRQFADLGMSAIAGRIRDEAPDEPFSRDPMRFDEMRPGCYEADARVTDMDINGVWASLNFPSAITGFCGRNLFAAQNVELGAACIRAWNDWIHDEWYLSHPERIIPLGVLYLPNPELAVTEIRRLAKLDFHTVSLPERPHLIGLPSLWDKDHWGPILRACIECDMVCSIHVGSTGSYELPPNCPFDRISAGLSPSLFGQLSLSACAEWLYSGWPLELPEIRIAMSEGGIGWVPMFLDRLDNIVDRSRYGSGWDLRPSDVLRRNFWFCTLDDPSTIDCRHTIGVENIMAEVDYPHGDSTWPITQQTIADCWGHVPAKELRKMCSENAAALFSHPLPPVVLPQHDLTRPLVEAGAIR
jgi:predicted TIM-barrel fold metal-dependent hydrolase